PGICAFCRAADRSGARHGRAGCGRRHQPQFRMSVQRSACMSVCRRTWLGWVFASSVVSVHAGSYEDFFRAIRRDNAGSIQRLLERGFDPNTLNENGQTGLLMALQLDSMRAFTALLAARNLNVEIRNAKDESPL